jgi:hypothetical protein
MSSDGLTSVPSIEIIEVVFLLRSLLPEDSAEIDGNQYPSCKRNGSSFQSFLQKAFDRLAANLKVICSVELRKIEESKEAIDLELFKSTERLNLSGLVALLNALTERCFELQVFDYGKVMRQINASTCKVISRFCAPEIGMEESKMLGLLNEIEMHETVPEIDAPWLIPFEINFEANFAHKSIRYPNMYKLTKAHHTEALNWYEDSKWGLKKKNITPEEISLAQQGMISCLYFWECLKVSSHELVHCVQSIAGQIDNSPLSWSAEHNASFLEKSLLWKTAEDEGDALFPPGFIDLIMFVESQFASSIWHEAFTDMQRSQYLIWRETFGLIPPSVPEVNENPKVVDHFKTILSHESMCTSDEDLSAQVKLVFGNGRTGRVQDHKVTIPERLKEHFAKRTFQSG